MDSKSLASAALAAVMAAGVVAPAGADEKKEKCYGIAKAGQNDCANLSGSHSCAGQATTDDDKTEWKLVKKGSCTKLGGLTERKAKKSYKDSKKN